MIQKWYKWQTLTQPNSWGLRKASQCDALFRVGPDGWVGAPDWCGGKWNQGVFCMGEKKKEHMQTSP